MSKKNKTLEPSWSRPEVTGTAPSRRSGHTLTLAAESDVCFLFGGMKLGQEGGSLTNELYRMSMVSGGNVHWTKETAAGRVPPPTWRHTANVFESTKVSFFIFLFYIILYWMEHESFSSLFRIDTIDRETKRKTERERTLRNGILD